MSQACPSARPAAGSAEASSRRACRTAQGEDARLSSFLPSRCGSAPGRDPASRARPHRTGRCYNGLPTRHREHRDERRQGPRHPPQQAEAGQGPEEAGARATQRGRSASDGRQAALSSSDLVQIHSPHGLTDHRHRIATRLAGAPHRSPEFELDTRRTNGSVESRGPGLSPAPACRRGLAAGAARLTRRLQTGTRDLLKFFRSV